MGLSRITDSRPLMRPWALAVPILVLLVALPLLRPLRHPDANEVSDDEASRLATVVAIVDHHTLSLENLDLGPSVPLPSTELIRSRGHIYSNQPPVFAVLLAGPYWVLTRFHLTLRNSPVLTPYLLTLIGVTLPVSAAAGLIYKMSRVFELRRPVRTAMAAIVVFGSGLVSYAVVINSHAPAATMVLGAVGGVIYVANSKKPRRNIWWFIGAGACSGLATVLDPPAAVFAPLLMLVILTMRWPLPRRTAAIGLFAIGLVPPIYLHLALNFPISGDYKPAILHRELELTRTGAGADLADWGSVGAALAPAVNPAVAQDDDQTPVAGWALLLRPGVRLFGCLFGAHGLLSHFPVLILGMGGMVGVLRRHWPGSTKGLAVVSAVGAAAVVVAYSFSWADVRGGMFANRWFVVFLPLALFWCGAWVKRRHHWAVWTGAAGLLIFSIAVSLIGATDPLPRGGYDSYTAAAAWHRFCDPPSLTSTPPLARADGE